MALVARIWTLLLIMVPCAAEDPPPPADRGAAEETIPAADRETLEKLERTKVGLDFDGASLRIVIDYLATTTGIRFQMEDETNPDNAVSIHLKSIYAKDAIRHLLSDAEGFDYYVKEGVVHVAPSETIRQQTYWKIYDMTEILKVAQERTDEMDRNAVVRYLKDHIARDSWKEGQLTLDGERLVVRQTGKAHGELAEILNRFDDIAACADENDALAARIEKQTFSLNVSGQPLMDVLQTVKESADIPGIVPELALWRSVEEKHPVVTISLDNVSVAKAFDEILISLGYGYYIRHGTTYVATNESVQNHRRDLERWKDFLRAIEKPRVIIDPVDR